MLKFHWLAGLVVMASLAGCGEATKPAAAPPANPTLGKASESPTPPVAAAQAEEKVNAADSDDQQAASEPAKSPATVLDAVLEQVAATQEAADTQVRLNLNFVNDEIVAAAVLHPQHTWNSPVAAGLREEGVLSDQDFGRAFEMFSSPTGLAASEIDEIAILVSRRVVQGMARDMGLPVEEDEAAGDAAVPDVEPMALKNNLKMIGLAFHNYHDVNNKFPKAGGPAAETEANKDGLSWRVQLLPYLGEDKLYGEFHLDEPWDSEHNKTLIERMPAFFAAGGEEAGKSSIHVFTNDGAPFANDAAPGIREFLDGTSNTVLCVSAGKDAADIWTKPGGLQLNAERPLESLGTIDGEGFMALLTDGTVRTLPKAIEPENFVALVTHAGGEAVMIDGPEPAHEDGPASPFGMFGVTPNRAPVIVITTSAAMNSAQVAENLLQSVEEKEDGGRKYFAAKSWAVAFPTEKILLFGDETVVKELLSQSETESTGSVAGQLRAATSPFDSLLAVDLTSQQALLQQLALQNPLMGPLANIRTLNLQSNLGAQPGEALLSLRGTSTTPETAQALAAMFNGLVLGQLQMVLGQIDQAPNATDAQKPIVEMFAPSLKRLKLETDGNALSLVLDAPEGFERLPQLVAPELRRAREDAQQMVKSNHLKQMGLAFHNYHDTFGRFPKAGGPAVATETHQDGLSWRVHLLPYIDQAPLYNQFRFDEPWDSEHNMALIPLMPEIFKAEGVDEEGKTSMHVFTGPGAPFADDNAPSVRDITDGTSHTLLCVIAGPDKAEIWTKPGGLDFDPDNPFAALGEIGDQWRVLLMDGATRSLPKTLEPVTLKRLIQHADGEKVDF